MQKKLFLLGLRASGKSTLGRYIASRHNLDFVDTDELCQRAAGMSIADLVAAQGWTAFRELESSVLRELLESSGDAVKPLVVATGGGIVLDDKNRQLIKNAGFGIYLEAGADLLHARLTANPASGHRPPLSDSPLLEEIHKNLAEREALYRECAQLTVPAGLGIEQLAGRIVEAANLQDPCSSARRA